MKKHILFGGFGILLTIAIVITFVIIRATSIHAVSSNIKSSLSVKSKYSPTPCAFSGPGICQGYVLVQRHGPGTLSPTPEPLSPTPTPPSPTPIPVIPPTPTTASTMGNGGEGTSIEKQLAQQLFGQINIDRAAQGLPPYAWNAILANGAYQHNIVMTTTGCGLLHQCPNEPTPCQRFKSEGITLPACAENIDYTYISSYPDAWTAIKMHTEAGELAEQPPNDGHRKNLLSTSLVQIGISILIDSQGRAWVTEDMTGAYP